MHTTTLQVLNFVTKSENRSSALIPGQYPLIPNEIQMVLDIVLYPVLSGSLSLFGVVSNSINIVVFWKQGVSESANISLLMVSVYDLGVCLFSIFMSVCTAIMRFGDIFVATAMFSLAYFAGAWPREFFLSLSMRTTVLLAIERCVCVVKPLEVKRWFSKKNTVAILSMFYLDLIPLTIAMFSTRKLQWHQQGHGINSTSFLVLEVSEIGQKVLYSHYVLNILTLTTLSIVVVSTCSVVMVLGVRRSQAFKQSAVSNQSTQNQSGTSKSLSSKETKLIKLVSYITTIFIVCNIPFMAVVIAELIEPELNGGRMFNNLATTLYGILYVFTSVNTSVNIIVYLNVSTNYKKVFMELCCFGREK